MQRGFLTYAWDLLNGGPEAILEQMADEMGCTAVVVNCTYHHARLYRPRQTGQRTLELPGAVALWRPNPARYPRENLVPESYEPVTELQVLERTRDAAGRLGMEATVWMVGLHNSTLGNQNPALCMQNCFGDRYEYSLCPAQPAVQAYLAGMVEDVCDQIRPERLLLEAIGYLGLRHGIHHEMFFLPWHEALELAFSLCFCPACKQRAAGAGVDAGGLQRRVAETVSEWLESERPPADEQASEMMATLTSLPGAREYLELRARTVTELVERVWPLCQNEGVELEVIPASFHRPLARAWLEGADVVELSQVCDRLLIPSYFDTAAEVEIDLAWARAHGVNGRIAAALNACGPGLATAAELAAQVAVCEAAGCEAVYTYNYGLLTHRRLAWVAEAYQKAGAA